MKSLLLSLALTPLLLTGCATSGYYSDYPGYYYDGPGYAYYDEPVVGIGFYDREGYHHDYHRYDTDAHHGYGGYASSHTAYHSTTRVASVSRSNATHASQHASRSVSVSSGRHNY